ncbi:MAG: hypothetical protein JNL70_14315 [Saprospiraceae bacterium]|nr:hypothetical protein [Saprospiraceae bacterium]
MKTRLFFVLTLAITLFTNSIKANNGSFSYDLGGGTNVRISAIENTKAVIVSLTNVSNEEVTIVLENEDATLLTETVKGQANFSKKYNLTNLEAGNYNVVVTKKATKTVQPFSLTNKTVVLFESERKEKFLPSINQVGSKVDVNVLLGNYSNIKVNIYNNEGRKVYDDINYVVLSLHKRYDLSKLTSGAYVVEVIAGDETQYFTITL